MVDWTPVWQHVLAAMAITAAAVLIGFPASAVAVGNALGWLLREAYQAHKRKKNLDPTEWSKRKKAEWMAPSIVGAAVAFMVSMTMAAFGIPTIFEALV